MTLRIKICFLKVRQADANLHAYVADASVITGRASLGKLTVLFCFQSINLRGAPYELVPGYFVTSFEWRFAGGPLMAR